jgi:uncharacterized protein YhdP
MSIGVGQLLAPVSAAAAADSSSAMPPAQQQHVQRLKQQLNIQMGQEQQQLVQLVQMLVLPVVDKKGWQAAIDALQAAEAAQQDAEEMEAALLQHAAQVGGSNPRPHHARHWHMAPAKLVAASGSVCFLLLLLLRCGSWDLDTCFGTPYHALHSRVL